MGTEIDDGLTEEERAALADDDGSGQQNAENTPAEDDKSGEQDDADKAKIDAEAAAATINNEQAADPAPILVAPPTGEAEAKLAEIASKKDDLLAQFDDGDITAKEYQKALDELMKQERGIEFEVHKAQLATEMEQQRQKNEWNATCNAFIESNPMYKDNPRLYRALDQEIRDLASKPENANWTGQKFLDEAHRNLKAAFGFADAASKTAKRYNPTDNLPPNLSKVPAADIEDTNGGRFAVLDRMSTSDPLGYEEALSKMSDAERNAYLNA